ncbi:MAG TPA: hypothetical protein VFP71_13840 [Candidatus Angelobacter sp.]|nr:hypothetical protein [Candidatus Angelobacter sp.]
MRLQAKRDHQLIGLTPKDEQVSILYEARMIFMYLFIRNLLGVVAAAVQGIVGWFFLILIGIASIAAIPLMVMTRSGKP